jgi:hypothetical protein
MYAETNPRSLLALESRILRALCSDPPPSISAPTDDAAAVAAPRATNAAPLTAARTAILAKLHAHPWQDPEHRVVFEALTLLPRRHATELREQLPAQATRMGFPDVNWQKYFTAPADDPAVETLVAQLLATSRKLNL